jgi:hypothetical protein
MKIRVEKRRGKECREGVLCLKGGRGGGGEGERGMNGGGGEGGE